MKILNFTTILILLVLLFSCQNEGKPDTEEGTNPTTEAEATTEKDSDSAIPENVTDTEAQRIIREANLRRKGGSVTLRKLQNTVTNMGKDKIVMQRGGSVIWGTTENSDTTTIIIVRHGETEEGKTSLNQNGNIRAGRLANVTQLAQIKGVFYSNNSEIQMGQHVAKSNKAPLMRYNNTKPADILDLIKKDYKGLRTMLVGSRESSADFVNRLAGKTLVKPADTNSYDKVYVCYLVNGKLVGGLDMDLYKLF